MVNPMTTTTATITVQVYTSDEAWAATYGTDRVEDGHGDTRVIVPGCTRTGGFAAFGREWVNYTLPAGAPTPKGWDKVAPGVLAAPAEWVTAA